jgi:hypothetical protein
MRGAFLHWQGIYGGCLVEVGVFQWRYILWSQSRWQEGHVFGGGLQVCHRSNCVVVFCDDDGRKEVNTILA